MSRPFRFKQFGIVQDKTPMKVGTDGVLLGAWAEGGRKILDVGSGTGLVALMMAQRFSEAVVVGIDICSEAVEEATYNVSCSPFCNRVRIELKDFRAIGDDEKFDTVVCNPPYFVNSMKCPVEGRSMARHDDSLSLDELFEGARRVMTDIGVLSIVIPYSQIEEAIDCGVSNDFHVKRAMRVRGNANAEWKRVLISFDSGRQHEWTMEEMTLEQQRGVRTEEYRRLTEEFYL